MKNKLKYRFDNLMSKGTGMLIASLAIVTLLMVSDYVNIQSTFKEAQI